MRVAGHVDHLVEEPYPASEQEHPHDHRDPAAVPIQVCDRGYRERGVYRGRRVEVNLADLVTTVLDRLTRPDGPGDEVGDGRLDELCRALKASLGRRALHDDGRAFDLADPAEYEAGRGPEHSGYIPSGKRLPEDARDGVDRLAGGQRPRLAADCTAVRLIERDDNHEEAQHREDE